MLRAWRGIDGFQPRAPLERLAVPDRDQRLPAHARAARPGRRPPRSTRTSSPTRTGSSTSVPSPSAGPEEVVEERERIGLAFVAAMQLLPPKQRVTVVLRDVLGWSAREVAELLDDSVPAVNSALQRGRDRLQRERHERTSRARTRPTNAARKSGSMRRFQEAWAAVDIDGIVALLSRRRAADDAPGGAALRGQRPDRQVLRHRPTRRPGSIGSGSSRRAPTASPRSPPTPTSRATACFDAYGVMVFAIRGDRIDGITGFPRQPELFTRLGLPTRLATHPRAERVSRGLRREARRTRAHAMNAASEAALGSRPEE